MLKVNYSQLLPEVSERRFSLIFKRSGNASRIILGHDRRGYRVVRLEYKQTPLNDGTLILQRSFYKRKRGEFVTPKQFLSLMVMFTVDTRLFERI